MLDRLITVFAVQRDNLFNILTPQLATENFSSFKRPKPLTPNNVNAPTKLDTSEIIKGTVTDLDPEDIPIDVSCFRDEVIEMLKSLNISFAKSTSTVK